MSNLSTTKQPILFEPYMEHTEEGEAQTITSLDETMATIRETTFAHSGHATRSVHAKSHGILHATLTVPGDLPPRLAHGLFSEAGSYEVVMRLSTIPGDILKDSISTPRGLALKVIGVQGDRLPGSEGDETQDFVMANAPAFNAPTAKDFLGNLKKLAGTTDKLEGLKEVASRFARAAEAILELFGTKSPLIVTLGGQQPTHILSETFYTQSSYLFGPFMGKFSLKPVSPSLKALAEKHIDLNGKPDALRESVIEYFGNQGAEWELQVQLNTNLEKMPIEDSSVLWPEDESPYVTIAHLSAPPQNAWSSKSIAEVDDCLSFSPWHGLAAHRPLGGVNRVRQSTYKQSAAFRGSHNGCPMHEPRRGAMAEDKTLLHSKQA
jgi:hypothetical protein